MLYLFFFFKQKTAYEMRISDWSSDVCSSDLPRRARRLSRALLGAEGDRTAGVLDQRTWRPLGVQYRCGGAACRAAPGNLLEPLSVHPAQSEPAEDDPRDARPARAPAASATTATSAAATPAPPASTEDDTS